MTSYTPLPWPNSEQQQRRRISPQALTKMAIEERARLLTESERIEFYNALRIMAAVWQPKPKNRQTEGPMLLK